MSSLRLVTLYAREGCHLCDDARSRLQQLAPRLRFELAEVDIESDELLLQRYVFAIPVIAVGEREVARAPITGHGLEEALREALA